LNAYNRTAQPKLAALSFWFNEETGITPKEGAFVEWDKQLVFLLY
jgi:hypothetical protein